LLFSPDAKINYTRVALSSKGEGVAFAPCVGCTATQNQYVIDDLQGLE